MEPKRAILKTDGYRAWAIEWCHICGLKRAQEKYFRYCFDERSERRTENWSMVTTCCALLVFHAVLLDSSHRQIACYRERVRSCQNTRKSLIKYRRAEIKTLQPFSNNIHELARGTWTFWVVCSMILNKFRLAGEKLRFCIIIMIYFNKSQWYWDITRMAILLCFSHWSTLFGQWPSWTPRLSCRWEGRGRGIRIRCLPCQLFREGGLCKTIAPLRRMLTFMEISIKPMFVCVYVTILRSIWGSLLLWSDSAP